MNDVVIKLAKEANDKAMEIARLQAENDKLREQVSSLVGRSFRTADKMSCIEADNAKLRELAVEVFECARRGAACETCKVNNDGYACVYIMRELGVEVTE